MDTVSVENFLHLSSTLSFSRTSRERNVSPSALSRQIQRLEEEVGQPLFVRDNRSVRLSSSGALFREFANDMVGKLEAVRARVGATDGTIRGSVTLYCSVTACYSILPEIIGRYRQDYPEVHLKLETGDEAFAIQRAREVDLVVAARPDVLPRGFEFRPVTRTPLVFVAPDGGSPVAELAAGKPVPWSRVPMILSERGLTRKRVDAWFRSQRIVPSIYAEVMGNEAILAMVGLGCGIGVVPRLVLEKSPPLAVRELSVKPGLADYTVGLCCRRRSLATPAVRAFWEVAGGDSRPARGPVGTI